jgi:peptide subunit release factor 1 (eRF1)
MAVETALRRAVALWGRLQPSHYPYGVIVFCSEDMAEALHPLQPLKGRLYSCGRHFDTTLVREQLEIAKAPVYGIIVIDGSDAVIGTASGVGTTTCHSAVTKLVHMQSNTASQTRRGGQSALRYSRLREAEDLAFRRRVAERAVDLLGAVRSLILAGKADTKRRLLPELTQQLRNKVACVIDLPCGANDKDALREAALRAGSTADAERRSSVDDSVRLFLETLQKPYAEAGILYCYGEQQTSTAISMGAVEIVLVASDCVSRGFKRTPTEWDTLATQYGTKMQVIEACSEDATHFCSGFGVGGLLRWALDPDLVEDAESETIEKPTDNNPAGNDCNSHAPGLAVGVPTADGETRERNSTVASISEVSQPEETTSCLLSSVFPWLGEALLEALADETSAEALSMCAEVILADESTERSEAISQAVSMLLSEGVPIEVVNELVVRAN